MGCTLGRPRGNQRMFRVFNVDKNGVTRNMGRIEITDEDLVLHQRGKEPICWPLRSLRRYGFDAELFSFESGRRCPTGQGIYAFKCQRAEALFNVLQECIQRAGQEDSGGRAARPTAATRVPPGGGGDWAAVAGDDPDAAASAAAVAAGYGAGGSASYMNTSVMASSAGNARLEAILNQHHQYVNTAPTAALNNNSSSTSNGELLMGLDSPDHLAAAAATATTGPTLHYAQLDLPPTSDGCPGNNTVAVDDDTEPLATYINIAAAGDIVKPPMLTTAAASRPSALPVAEPVDYSSVQCVTTVTTTSSPVVVGNGGNASTTTDGIPLTTDVNYIQVHIMNDVSVPASPAATQVMTSTAYQFPGELPAATAAVGALSGTTDNKYVTIDFDKTNAINARNHTDDEGSRKTRHNSNLEDCA